MSQSDLIIFCGVSVAALQVVILVGQYYLSRWMTNETKQIRIDAAAQNELIKKQLDEVTAQNVLLKQDLERKFAREDMEAKPYFYWNYAQVEHHINYRMAGFTNLGGNIIIKEIRCTVPSFETEGGSFVRQGEVFKFRLSFLMADQIFIGIKYINMLKQEKTIVFRLAPNEAKAVLDSMPYETVAGAVKVSEQF